MKRREGLLVRYRVVVGEIPELLGNRYSVPAETTMVVSDDDVNIGHMPCGCGLEITKPDRLQPHIRVVEVLNRGLDKQGSHSIDQTIAYPTLPEKGSLC
jgi:hypothetical protein